MVFSSKHLFAGIAMMLASFAFVLSGHSAEYTISDLTDIQTPNTALMLRPGDTVNLPAAGSGQYYQSLNVLFSSCEGNVLTAKAPGIVTFVLRTSTAEADIVKRGFVIILPPAANPNRVFIWDQSSSTKDLWCRATTWKQVGVAENDTWPSEAGDIVYIPYYNNGYTIRPETDITIGDLYAGAFDDLSERKLIVESSNGSNSCITFDRGDGQPSVIQLCPNNGGDRWGTHFQLGGYATPVAIPNGLIVDHGFGQPSDDGLSASSGRARALFRYKTTTIEIPEGKSLVHRGGSPKNYGITGSDIAFESSPVFSGAGDFVHTGVGQMLFATGKWGDFTGRIIEQAGPHTGGFDRGANFMLWNVDTASNATMVVRGAPYRSDWDGWTDSKSIGFLRGGVQHGYGDLENPCGNRMPGKGLWLDGGYIWLTYENKNWASKGCYTLSNCVETLTLDKGFTRFSMNGAGYDAVNVATNLFSAGSVAATGNGGTLFISEPNTQNGKTFGTTGSYKSLVFFGNYSGAGSYGAGTDPATTETYTIRPDIITRYNNWDDLMFASVDANGQLKRQMRTQLTALKSAEANINAFVQYTSNNSMALDEDLTLNSLSLHNYQCGAANRILGDGKTLTITSGGLILNRDRTAIG